MPVDDSYDEILPCRDIYMCRLRTLSCVSLLFELNEESLAGVAPEKLGTSTKISISKGSHRDRVAPQ